ncbi:hypothetical protein BP5796_09422 [Coleophoma crateriformis]|uniref:Uncharacterized protein n=1 Tax=Coleophoma crateriformis TaxID=565419 RepID=A0A3D8QXX4_9HELO|nr:hypothetical protein BP5796_09422 [Coleophoma crateriformis]
MPREGEGVIPGWTRMKASRPRKSADVACAVLKASDTFKSRSCRIPDQAPAMLLIVNETGRDETRRDETGPRARSQVERVRVGTVNQTDGCMGNRRALLPPPTQCQCPVARRLELESRGRRCPATMAFHGCPLLTFDTAARPDRATAVTASASSKWAAQS